MKLWEKLLENKCKKLFKERQDLLPGVDTQVQMSSDWFRRCILKKHQSSSLVQLCFVTLVITNLFGIRKEPPSYLGLYTCKSCFTFLQDFDILSSTSDDRIQQFILNTYDQLYKLIYFFCLRLYCCCWVKSVSCWTKFNKRSQNIFWCQPAMSFVKQNNYICWKKFSKLNPLIPKPFQ